MAETIDLERYRRGVERTAEEKATIQQEHLNRLGAGEKTWNDWAAEVEAALENESPPNVSEEKN